MLLVDVALGVNFYNGNRMLRKTLSPRPWWLLVLPLAFYLTRMAWVCKKEYYDYAPYWGEIHTLDSVDEALKQKPDYIINGYQVAGIDLRPNVYQVVYFISIGCLIIGSLSVAKDLLLTNSGNTTRP